MNNRHALRKSLISAAVAAGTVAGLVSVPLSAGASAKTVTITIWNDALAASSSTVPNSKSFLTKGVALFEKANPNIKLLMMQTIEPLSKVLNNDL